jgi:hypothetical protein
VRFWPVPDGWRLPGGFQVGWLAAATYDRAVGISLFTKPTPQEDLVGLVYSETPKEVRQDPLEHTYPWYRRTLPLAGISLVMVTILNILF